MGKIKKILIVLMVVVLGYALFVFMQNKSGEGFIINLKNFSNNKNNYIKEQEDDKEVDLKRETIEIDFGTIVKKDNYNTFIGGVEGVRYQFDYPKDMFLSLEGGASLWVRDDKNLEINIALHSFERENNNSCSWKDYVDQEMFYEQKEFNIREADFKIGNTRTEFIGETYMGETYFFGPDVDGYCFEFSFASRGDDYINQKVTESEREKIYFLIDSFKFINNKN